MTAVLWVAFPGFLPGHAGDAGVEPRGFEPLTFSLRTRRATNCAKAPEVTGVDRSVSDFTTAPRVIAHGETVGQADAAFAPPSCSSTATASTVSAGVSAGASAVTGTLCRPEEVTSGAERSMVRTVRGASGLDT